jgi:hypothetical protein
MKVFLHIGIEKTGSSHIQSLCSINRELLRINGLWYPGKGKGDDLSKKGEISSGNAQKLADLINQNATKNILSFLEENIEEAKTKECDKLLLSNELLLLALADEHKLNHFNEVLKQLKDSTFDFLLVLRDPVDQALSLYKHRAKSGKIHDIEEWPNDYYFYGDALNRFLTNYNNLNFNLHVEKFKKENGYLEDMFFKKWLKLDINLKNPPKVVNPSLSLSELMLIRKIRENNSQLVPVLYKKMISIDKKRKSEDFALEQYYKRSLSEHMNEYEKTWDLCNSFLASENALVLPVTTKENLSLTEKNFSFSKAQIDELAKLIVETSSIKFIIKHQKRKIKQKVIKIL